MKKMKYLCCSIIFIFVIMFSMSYAALCPVNGGKHVYSAATCTKPKTCDCGATTGSALGHNYKSHVSSKVKVATADNCLRIKTTYTCTRCSSSYAKWTYDTSHNYSSTVTQQATCTSTGIITYTCKDCGYTTTNTIVKKAHTYSEATCTAPAKCTVCGATSGSAKGHDYKVVRTKESTCTEEGIDEYTCKNCNKSYTETVAKKSHTYSGASCTAPAKCTVCGATSGSAKGHDYKVVRIKESTCTEEGIDEYTCKNCNKSYTETVAKKAHTYSGASCTAPAKCTVCGATSGSAKGHDYKNAGYTYLDKNRHYQECNTCGAKLYGEHNLENGKCTLCNYNVECKHTNVSDPTCTKAGYCEFCGQAVKPALGHDYQPESVSTEKPTSESLCTTTITKYKCSRCNKITTETINNQHYYGEYIQNTDYHVRFCVACGKEQKENHKFVEDKVLREATCITEGEIQYKCSTCGYEKTENIKKVSHVYNGAKGYSSDPKYHYTRCQWCETVNSKGIDHVWNEDRVCIHCNYVCKHSYETIKDKGKWKLRCTFCNMIKEDDTCDHDYSYVSDVYGHYYKCTKCKNVDKTKSGAHKYETKATDLCNGFHEKKCTAKGCDYALITPHVYINGKCIACGSQNTTGIQSKVNATGVSIDLTSKSEDSQKLQEKLVSLGYDVGGADGIVGSNTIKALNQLLADQGSSREIKSKDEITPEIFQLLMICEETREEAQARINKKQAEELIKDLENKINNEQATNEEKIQYAQIILQRLGYYPASEGINGSANSITSDAIKIYCISNEIDVSDINVKDMDFDFLKKLGKTTKTYAEVKQGKLAQIKSGKIDLDMSSENQRMEIQLMLKASGYYTGSINGELDSNTKKALKQLCEDKGLGFLDITDWSQVTLEEFAVIATTDKKGLEEYKRSDENDRTWMGAVKDGSAYRATHGFRYCMRCGKTSVIVDDSVRATCKNSKCQHKGLETIDGNYVVDCSTAVSSDLYYYGKANGSETYMKIFSTPRFSGVYNAAVKNGGYVDGVKCFDVIDSKEDLKEGDIFVYYKETKNGYEGHVEVYAGSMADDVHAYVYNAGDYKSVATAGESTSTHNINNYSILRPISPDKVAKLDDQN